MNSVTKENVEVWAGTLTVSGSTYNMYLIEGVRQIKASELKDKVSDYCGAHANDTNCRQIMANNYCQNNPDDSRCKEVFRKYCLLGNNLDDKRCRDYIRERCQNAENEDGCAEFALQRAKSYCEENSGSNLCKKIGENVANFCQNNTDNQGCVRIKNLIQDNPKLLKNAATIRTKLRTMVVNAGNAQQVGTQAQTGNGTQNQAGNQGGG